MLYSNISKIIETNLFNGIQLVVRIEVDTLRYSVAGTSYRFNLKRAFNESCFEAENITFNWEVP